ncbi:tetratricopeptide repeat protein [Limnoglobus roseus]|uniref:Tetratricopeptide repeat protein n=1 Tax=Limnoglobus roseus TaxID=2598579 RepID=A0A5C1A8D9_9BACT|nr:tetratricopeptide repeat protein [Limnoglobus roseus]
MDAAHFAVGVQKSHLDEPIVTPLGRVQVRVGLHTGEPLADADGSGRLVGQEVDYGARLTALAEGDQILLSNATSALLEQAMLDKAHSHAHGHRDLKGIGRVPIFELLFEGKTPQPLRESAASPHNLPPRPPRVTGRDELLLELRERLHAGGVTVLMGEGGMGKTTLVLAAAHDTHQAGDAPGGVCWINCETKPDLAECLRQAAEVFFGERAETEPLAALIPRVSAHLLGRRPILILDNFETVAADVELRRWLSTVRPPARVVVTTREVPAGLAGRVVPVHELARDDAVRLFQTRVAEAGVADALDECLVHQLCAAVGDHPLSVDLLAACAARTPVQRLYDQLQKGLTVLDARNDPNRPDRHQSARAGVTGSVAELSPAAAQLLWTVSVLPTGFGPDVLAAVTRADEFDDAAEELVAVSLWRFRGQLYTLHPLIRQYAYEQLRAKGGAAAAELQAARGMAACLAAQEANVRPGPRFSERSRLYLTWCADQLPNIVAAAEFAERHDDWVLIPQLAQGMEFFWNTRGHWPVAATLGEKSLEAARRLVDPTLEAFGHDYLGFVYRHVGRDEEAVRSFQRALAVYDAHPTAAAQRPLTHARLGKELTVLARYDEANQYIRRAVEGYRAAGDRNGEATALVYLGQNTKFQKDWSAAIALFHESIALARELGNLPLEREIRYQLGDTLIQLGRYDEAGPHLEASAEQARTLGNEDAEGKAVSGLGTIALRRGQFGLAREYLQRAISIHRRTGFRNREGRALRRMAELELAAGDRPAALELARQSVAVLREVEAPEARAKSEAFLRELLAGQP